MTHTKILTALFLLLICLSGFACKKENSATTDDEAFCTFVNTQNFEATGALINDFLAPLSDENKELQLQKLTDWLNNKSCVDASSIVCQSCILTGPAQSELSVRFNANGQVVTMTLDIIMGEPLKFRAYHL